MLNLLANAIKFTTPNKSIFVSAISDSDWLLISVKDTGIGIPEDQLERITEPFSQVETNLQRAHEGTGLGLSIVQLLVELHGGTLEIESVVGIGTNVKVRFPRTGFEFSSG